MHAGGGELACGVGLQPFDLPSEPQDALACVGGRNRSCPHEQPPPSGAVTSAVGMLSDFPAAALTTLRWAGVLYLAVFAMSAAGVLIANTLWFVALGLGARILRPLFRRPATWRVLDAGVALTITVLPVTLARASTR